MKTCSYPIWNCIQYRTQAEFQSNDRISIHSRNTCIVFLYLQLYRTVVFLLALASGKNRPCLQQLVGNWHAVVNRICRRITTFEQLKSAKLSAESYMSEANSFSFINLLGTFSDDSVFWDLSTVHPKKTLEDFGYQHPLEKCVCCLLKTKVHGVTTEHKPIGLWKGSEWSGCVVGSMSLFSE